MARKHNFTMGFMSYIFVMVVVAAFVFSGCNMQRKMDSQTTAESTNAKDTEAISETPRSNAIRAYQELLQSSPALEGEHSELDDPAFGYDENLAKFGKHYDYFAIWDLNCDDVPELAAMTIINNRWTPVSIFTFNAESGEIILLKDPLDPESHATFQQMSTAAGTYDLYLCKDNHIHNVWSGNTPIGFQTENHAFRLNEAVLAAVECSLGDKEEAGADEVTVHFFDVAKQNTEGNRNAIEK